MRAINNQNHIRILQVIVLVLASACLYHFSRLGTKHRQGEVQPVSQVTASNLLETEDFSQALALVANYEGTPVSLQPITTTIGRNLFVSKSLSQPQSRPKASLTERPPLAITMPVTKETTSLLTARDATADIVGQQAKNQAKNQVGDIIKGSWQVVAISTDDIEVRDLQSGRHYHINPPNLPNNKVTPQPSSVAQAASVDKVAPAETAANLPVELFSQAAQPKTYQQLLQQRALNKHKAGK